MKQIIYITILTLVIGCVPQSDYDKLKKENEVLRAELDEIKFGAERLLKEADFAFNEKNYDLSKQKAELILEKHAGTDYAVKAKALIDKIDSIEKARLAKEKAEKEKLERQLNQYVSKKHDDFQKCTFYETKRETETQPEKYGPRFQVEIYIGHGDTGNKWLRLRTNYRDDDWMFYKKIELLGDNGTQISIDTDYPEKKSDSGGGGVREWSDNNVDSDLIIKLDESKTIKYRFDGQYRYTYNMNWSQRQAFKEIVAKYKSL